MHDTRPLTGILLMLGAVFFFAALDATSKYMAQTFPVPMLVWARYSVHLLLMVIFLAPSLRLKLVATQRPREQILRGLTLVITSIFGMAGFAILPLAEATAFLFVAPLIVVILAHWLLHERITPGRWLAVVAGFSGALLIARPGGALSVRGVVFMLLAAICYAIYQVQTRRLSATENTLTLLFYTALAGTAAMTLAAPFYWGGPMPGLLQTLQIVSMGVFGGVGHLLLTRAFRHAPASTLSPFTYAQLIWATLFGWLFYNHLPDGFSSAGIAIIVASSASLALSERIRKPAPPDMDITY